MKQEFQKGRMKQTNMAGVLERRMATKDVCVLIARTCEYVILHG